MLQKNSQLLQKLSTTSLNLSWLLEHWNVHTTAHIYPVSWKITESFIPFFSLDLQKTLLKLGMNTMLLLFLSFSQTPYVIALHIRILSSVCISRV
jgi:fumarate reductase subunit C